MLFFSTRSFRTFHLTVLDEVKVVARLALGDDLAASGEFYSFQSGGDSLQSAAL